MERNIYQLAQGQLTMCDDLLGINIDEPFVFSALPKDLSSCKEEGRFSFVYFESGAISKVYTRQGGLYHGEAIELDREGNLFSQCYFSEGRLHGPSRFFSAEGSLLSVTWFYRGRQQGRSFLYYADGSCYAALIYQDGQLHGEQRYFYPNGTIRSCLPYDGGTLHGQVLLYHENGSIKRQCSYLKGKKDGIDRLTAADGVVLDEGLFSMSQPIAEHIRRYPSGVMREKIYFGAEGSIQKVCFDKSGAVIVGDRDEPLV